jgi:hypothetical protein
MNKREPGPNDQYIEPCLYYGKNRKEQFLNCIKECIQQELSEVDDNYQMYLILRLWSACLDTAKILSLRTQNGGITKEIRRLSILTVHSRVTNDPIYRKGVNDRLPLGTKS